MTAGGSSGLLALISQTLPTSFVDRCLSQPSGILKVDSLCIVQDDENTKHQQLRAISLHLPFLSIVRTIVFLCHSIGGMLLPRLLPVSIAREKNGNTHQRFLDTISAILFINTPHSAPQETETRRVFVEGLRASTRAVNHRSKPTTQIRSKRKQIQSGASARRTKICVNIHLERQTLTTEMWNRYYSDTPCGGNTGTKSWVTTKQLLNHGAVRLLLLTCHITLRAQQNRACQSNRAVP